MLQISVLLSMPIKCQAGINKKSNPNPVLRLVFAVLFLQHQDIAHVVGGGGASAADGTQANNSAITTTGDQVAKFAGRMGNIVANSMAGGFGATLGSRAAHSVWNGVTGRR